MKSFTFAAVVTAFLAGSASAQADLPIGQGVPGVVQLIQQFSDAFANDTSMIADDSRFDDLQGPLFSTMNHINEMTLVAMEVAALANMTLRDDNFDDEALNEQALANITSGIDAGLDNLKSKASIIPAEGNSIPAMLTVFDASVEYFARGLEHVFPIADISISTWADQTHQKIADVIAALQDSTATRTTVLFTTAGTSAIPISTRTITMSVTVSGTSNVSSSLTRKTSSTKARSTISSVTTDSTTAISSKSSSQSSSASAKGSSSSKPKTSLATITKTITAPASEKSSVSSSASTSQSRSASASQSTPAATSQSSGTSTSHSSLTASSSSSAASASKSSLTSTFKSSSALTSQSSFPPTTLPTTASASRSSSPSSAVTNSASSTQASSATTPMASSSTRQINARISTITDSVTFSAVTKVASVSPTSFESFTTYTVTRAELVAPTGQPTVNSTVVLVPVAPRTAMHDRSQRHPRDVAVRYAI